MSKELSCGTSLDFYFDLDPEYTTPYLATGVTTTESGLSRVMEQLREYVNDDDDDAYDRIVDTLSACSPSLVISPSSATRTMACPCP